jgi:hypothetical protein
MTRDYRRPIDGSPWPGDIDPPLPTLDVLRRHGARLLDPTKAVVLPGQDDLRPTAYVANQLLVSTAGPDTERTVAALRDAARRLGLDAADEYPPDGPRSGLRRVRFAVPPTIPRRRMVDPLPILDAWRVLQLVRRRNLGAARAVQLDHLVFADTGPAGGGTNPPSGPGTDGYHSPNPFAGGGGQVPGGWDYAGRRPVRWLGPPPHRADKLPSRRRPVVAIVDGGCAAHPWFADKRGVVVRAMPAIGLDGPGPEDRSDVVGPMDGALDAFCGHGTHAAGIVHQKCPDANIMPVRVFDNDGVVRESFLIQVLKELATVARQHIDGGQARAIDVVSLSLGTSYESTPVLDSRPALYEVLKELGDLGVIVCVSAGNCATRRQQFPAAFAPNSDGPVKVPERGRVPVISVGALNLDGSVALFSNSGPWVVHFEPGVSLVSTFPAFDGGMNPAAAAVDPSGRPRRSIDPDNFPGFAIWDGTSFAGPVLAGRLAQKLLDRSTAGSNTVPLDETDQAASVTRAWDAVSKCTALRRP